MKLRDQLGRKNRFAQVAAWVVVAVGMVAVLVLTGAVIAVGVAVIRWGFGL